MTPCAYCGHTYAEHVGPRCWGEQRALPSGWRSCRCGEYQETPVEAVALDVGG